MISSDDVAGMVCRGMHARPADAGRRRRRASSGSDPKRRRRDRAYPRVTPVQHMMQGSYSLTTTICCGHRRSCQSHRRRDAAVSHRCGQPDLGAGSGVGSAGSGVSGGRGGVGVAGGPAPVSMSGAALARHETPFRAVMVPAPGTTAPPTEPPAHQPPHPAPRHVPPTARPASSRSGPGGGSAEAPARAEGLPCPHLQQRGPATATTHRRTAQSRGIAPDLPESAGPLRQIWTTPGIRGPPQDPAADKTGSMSRVA